MRPVIALLIPARSGSWLGLFISWRALASNHRFHLTKKLLTEYSSIDACLRPASRYFLLSWYSAARTPHHKSAATESKLYRASHCTTTTAIR